MGTLRFACVLGVHRRRAPRCSRLFFFKKTKKSRRSTRHRSTVFGLQARMRCRTAVRRTPTAQSRGGSIGFGRGGHRERSRGCDASSSGTFRSARVLGVRRSACSEMFKKKRCPRRSTRHRSTVFGRVRLGSAQHFFYFSVPEQADGERRGPVTRWPEGARRHVPPRDLSDAAPPDSI